MIENDVVTYLTADATLDGYLGSSATDTKIYPEYAVPKKARPYMTFSIGQGIVDEVIDEERITFKVYCTTKTSATNILNRLKTLLDLQDSVNGVVTSSDYYIYHSRLTFYETLPDNTDVGNPKFVAVATFNIKFLKKT